MRNYSDLVDRVFRAEHSLGKLTPSETLDWELSRQIREADDATLCGGKTPEHPDLLPVLRGGLFYAVDALDAGHKLFQDAAGDLGSYWHGMIHRREGDFDNARYWFRRCGTLGCFAALHRDASAVSPDMARQSAWDPYLFTGQCEQARFGAEELLPELVKLQRLEFAALFDYSWQKAGFASRTA